MNAAPDNLKADLEAAMESLDLRDRDEPEPSMKPSADEPLASAGTDVPPASPSAEASPSEPAAPEQADGSEPEERTPSRRKPLAAPIDWAPELKQQFATLPEPLQKAIHSREVAINKTLQDTAGSRRLAEHFVQTVQPYEALMKAEGAQHPLQAVQQLLNTAATLAMGSPVAKAQRIAGLIQHYGVDIETLDKALAGSLPENTEETRLQKLLDQKLAPYQQFMQQVDQTRQQQSQQVMQQATQTVEEFGQDPKNEYFDQVRTTMAEFLDVAAAQGYPMGLEEAYQRACLATPGITEEIMRRHNAGGTQSQRMGLKQQAASSINGTRSAGGSGKVDYSNMSLRETLEAQFPGQQRI